MKTKWISLAVAFFVISSILPVFSKTTIKNFLCDLTFYKNKYVFKIQGHPIEMPVKVYVDEDADLYMIPLRFLANSLRYDVQWDSARSIASFSSQWNQFSIKINNEDSFHILSSSYPLPHITLQHDRIYADASTIENLFDISIHDLQDPNSVTFSTLRERIYIEAPNFVLKDAHGYTFDLYKELEKPKNEFIILNFYATRCPFCLKALPMLVKLSDDYKEQNISVVGVNTDTAGQENDRDEKLEKYGVQYTVVQDINNNVYDRYRVAGVPNFYVISPSHEIVYHSLVADEEQIQLLRDWLDLHLKEL
ncbi:MAG: redoxin domain-containing protein [Caldisericia bacterium]|nr:redoxin domain-containing protein [Caldisericia bacterium]